MSTATRGNRKCHPPIIRGKRMTKSGCCQEQQRRPGSFVYIVERCSFDPDRPGKRVAEIQATGLIDARCCFEGEFFGKSSLVCGERISGPRLLRHGATKKRDVPV